MQNTGQDFNGAFQVEIFKPRKKASVFGFVITWMGFN
jgi:hypothetical protein